MDDISLSCDDIIDGNLIIKYKNQNFIFQPDKKIEALKPSGFSFYYLLSPQSEQAELDRRLAHIPEFKKFIEGLRECVKNKSEIWNLLNRAFSLTLGNGYYINLVTEKRNEPINKIYVHLKNSDVLLAFSREKTTWYLEDIALSSEAESLRR